MCARVFSCLGCVFLCVRERAARALSVCVCGEAGDAPCTQPTPCAFPLHTHTHARAGAGVGQARFGMVILLVLFAGKYRDTIQLIPALVGFSMYQVGEWRKRGGVAKACRAFVGVYVSVGVMGVSRPTGWIARCPDRSIDRSNNPVAHRDDALRRRTGKRAALSPCIHMLAS